MSGPGDGIGKLMSIALPILGLILVGIIAAVLYRRHKLNKAAAAAITEGAIAARSDLPRREGDPPPPPPGLVGGSVPRRR